MLTAALVLLALGALYWLGTWNFDYWEKRGVKHDKPLPWIGNNGPAYMVKKSMTELAVDLYHRYPNERVVGFFRSTKPELIIRDPEIVKRIIVTDFAHFHHRGLKLHETETEPLMRNLFFADGDLWRLLRQRMTPAFTSGKLKAMFPLIVERAERLQTRALAAADAAEPLDARDLMARYTTDFIGACGFGLDADSLNDENSEFRKLGAKIFKVLPEQILKITLREFFPEAFKFLRLFPHVEADVLDLVDSILKQRNYQPSGRNDFIDLLLECQRKGAMSGESLERAKPDGSPETVTMELTTELIAAQVFVFFAAGFETSSSATSFTLHQLAFHPEVQARAQADVDRALAAHGNRLSYDAVRDMTYLQWTFKEGMRMFPSLGFLYRQCARPYTFEDLGFSVDEGVKIMIPLQAIQNDPKYFDSPEEFRPERFDPEHQPAGDAKFTYLPFGEGPRACIGERLGMLQSVAGLAAVLAVCSVSPAPTTRHPPLVDHSANVTQAVLGGLPLLFRKRTTAPLLS